jgi:betaine-aldehyde dehydrogenase
LNRQSTPSDTSERSSRADALPRDDLEESRRSQLISVTIDSLAELGYVSSTLAQIAGRAGVSSGLVAHYFGDKDGLLEAAFRSLSRRVGDQVRARLHPARPHPGGDRRESRAGRV